MVRDDKRQQYYLLVVKGDRRVDWKAFRRQHQTRPLSFASEEELMQCLGLTPGSVTPFGVLNDNGYRVTVFLDDYFVQPPGRIGVHPNTNTAAVWLSSEDLMRVLREHGAEVEWVTL